LVQELDKPAKEKGLNRVNWNLRYGGAEVRRPPTEEETAFGGPPRGPHVLPGSYTVKLIVGDKTLEQPLEVRLDPTINVPLADLQAQLDLQMKLRDMQSAANSALRFLDSIEEQLKHTQTTARNLTKEPDKEMMKALEDYVKQINALQDRLARRSEGLGFPGKSQVVNRIGDIFFGLDGTNAAPSPAQRQYYQEIQPEFCERMTEVNRFINDTVPQWNEKLRAWNLPTLTTRKPVDLSLFELKTSAEVKMPSEYDEMTERAHINYDCATPEAKRLRELLRSAMAAEGFAVYEPEWWHYDYKEWKEYPIMNIKFSEIE
jgi:hypothetical protein